MRWAHDPNRGFLDSLEGLARTAAEIHESDEAERCTQFLAQLDPDHYPAGSAPLSAPRHPVGSSESGARWAGVVLCGGSSTRMGRDKASIGSPPWAHRVAGALAAAGCPAVELQGGDPELGTSLWEHHEDEVPGGGPAPAWCRPAPATAFGARGRSV
ncbi:MAG: DUF3151 family protein [Microthrixaceae bacterium]